MCESVCLMAAVSLSVCVYMYIYVYIYVYICVCTQEYHSCACFDSSLRICDLVRPCSCTCHGQLEHEVVCFGKAFIAWKFGCRYDSERGIRTTKPMGIANGFVETRNETFAQVCEHCLSGNHSSHCIMYLWVGWPEKCETVYSCLFPCTHRSCV